MNTTAPRWSGWLVICRPSNLFARSSPGFGVQVVCQSSLKNYQTAGARAKLQNPWSRSVTRSLLFGPRTFSLGQPEIRARPRSSHNSPSSHHHNHTLINPSHPVSIPCPPPLRPKRRERSSSPTLAVSVRWRLALARVMFARGTPHLT
jgi:hypothetical protein